MQDLPRLRTPAFPIVVSGPSGVGKTVLCSRLVGRLPWTARSISATTRPPRDGEKHGEHYFFHPQDRFEAEVSRGGLVEWAKVHGYHYGTPRAWMEAKLQGGTCVVLNIDVQGGLQVRRAIHEALLVFVLPPSLEVLKQRLSERATDSPEEIRRRLDTALRELDEIPHYDYVVVNDELEPAVEELTAITVAERARVARRLVLG